MSDSIRVGANVEILQPQYLAGMVGEIVAKEEVQTGQSSDRWIVRVPELRILVSLDSHEFRLMSSG